MTKDELAKRNIWWPSRAKIQEFSDFNMGMIRLHCHGKTYNAFCDRRFLAKFVAARAALSDSGLPPAFWSIACMDAIDKQKYLRVATRDGSNKCPVQQLKTAGHRGRFHKPKAVPVIRTESLCHKYQRQGQGKTCSCSVN